MSDFKGSELAGPAKQLLSAADENGNPMRMVGICQDITERTQIEQQLGQQAEELELRNRELKRNEKVMLNLLEDLMTAKDRLQLQAQELTRYNKEKELLLKEIHHRVKNNLQVVCSLLNLQSRSIGNKRIPEILRECQDRVKVMAYIHEKLYKSEDLARINFAQYIRDLTSSLLRSYKVNTNAISLKINADHTGMGIDAAIPCGLIINELVSNALKHAFHEGNGGEICVELSSDQNGNYKLIVKDNGIGLPKHFDLSNTDSLGLKLVRSLTDQLQGTIEIKDNAGTEFQIVFREPTQEGGLIQWRNPIHGS